MRVFEAPSGMAVSGRGGAAAGRGSRACGAVRAGRSRRGTAKDARRGATTAPGIGRMAASRLVLAEGA
jgi:hypothetical protein